MFCSEEAHRSTQKHTEKPKMQAAIKEDRKDRKENAVLSQALQQNNKLVTMLQAHERRELQLKRKISNLERHHCECNCSLPNSLSTMPKHYGQPTKRRTSKAAFPAQQDADDQDNPNPTNPKQAKTSMKREKRNKREDKKEKKEKKEKKDKKDKTDTTDENTENATKMKHSIGPNEEETAENDEQRQEKPSNKEEEQICSEEPDMFSEDNDISKHPIVELCFGDSEEERLKSANNFALLGTSTAHCRLKNHQLVSLKVLLRNLFRLEINKQLQSLYFKEKKRLPLAVMSKLNDLEQQALEEQK